MTAAGDHMRAEIIEQPARWKDLASTGHAAIAAAADLIRTAQPELIVFIARGSSDHAAQYGQYLTHNLLGIPGLLATPGTTTVYHKQIRYPRSVGIAVSQSGESPDLLETVQATQTAGIKVIGLTNNPDSTLARLVDLHVPLLAGHEAAVAATKTYTCELLALNLVLTLASGSSWHTIADGVEAISGHAAQIIREEIDSPGLLGSLHEDDKAMVIGRGYSMATAKEGALKLMETCMISASGWSATDATHGPLGQVTPGLPVIGLTSDPASAPSVRSFLAAARVLGARVLKIEISTTDAALTPLLDILPIQAAALRTALAKGLDPDVPTGLLKVTRTV